GKLAVMGENFRGISADIYIVKPTNYADSAAYAVETGKDGEKFLYLPAFMSEEDLKGVEAHIAPFDGIYAEGYYGVACAKKWGKKLFCGTGFNLANPVAVNQAAAFDYFALSKELDFAEQRELAAQNAFVLSAGKIKVMDFIYCPFGKTCSACENKDEYILTDSDKREFVLRRYKTAGGCRFELFNPADLVAPQTFANVLIDLSALPMPVAKGVAAGYDDREKLKELLPVSTSGHSKKSVL
ncbi:MAG: hypothetical protein J6Z36_04995, partial [Clostridia bacterium]|nr:hypothetical protein [Clostridia bacterium]